MIFATGGFWFGDTITKSRSFSSASFWASVVGITPKFSPSLPINLTSLHLMFLLIRAASLLPFEKSLLIIVLLYCTVFNYCNVLNIHMSSGFLRARRVVRPSAQVKGLRFRKPET